MLKDKGVSPTSSRKLKDPCANIRCGLHAYCLNGKCHCLEGFDGDARTACRKLGKGMNCEIVRLCWVIFYMLKICINRDNLKIPIRQVIVCLVIARQVGDVWRHETLITNVQVLYMPRIEVCLLIWLVDPVKLTNLITGWASVEMESWRFSLEHVALDATCGLSRRQQRPWFKCGYSERNRIPIWILPSWRSITSGSIVLSIFCYFWLVPIA